MEVPQLIRQYISKGETKKAIELLLEYATEKNLDFQNTSQLLSSRYNKWKKNNLRGLNNLDDEARQIDNAILELLSLPDTDEVLDPTTITTEYQGVREKSVVASGNANSRTKRISLLVAVGIVFLLGGGYLVSALGKPKIQINYPANESTVSRALGQYKSYKIDVNGTGPPDRKIYGEYLHRDGIYTDLGKKGMPVIQTDSEGNWDTFFWHSDSIKREEFTFRVFRYDGKTKKKLGRTAIDSVKFYLIPE